MAYALVATSTPGATSVKLRTESVYHLPASISDSFAARLARAVMVAGALVRKQAFEAVGRPRPCPRIDLVRAMPE
jgi:hypothetical protein